MDEEASREVAIDIGELSIDFLGKEDLNMSSEEDVWYPDEELVARVHNIMLERYGGYPGFERGIQVFKYIIEDAKREKDIYRKAAIILRRLVTDRVFKDGNHRTAQVISQAFLEMNGVKLKAKNKEEIIRFIKDIRFYNIDEIEKWFKDGTTPRPR